ncbi:MAG: helix-turn-helix domain-containing protein [Chloroflexota bacterium]
MLTVPEAARRTERNPETIRRWIRGGKLESRKVGTQHLIEAGALDQMLAAQSEMLPLPESWKRTHSGAPLPDVVAAVRRSRAGH